MRLFDWVQQRGFGELTRLRRATGLGYTAIHEIYRGIRKCRYDTAKAISEATGGVVSIAELCEPVRAPKRRLSLRSRVARARAKSLPALPRSEVP